MAASQVVIGLDGGGTTTRALCADLTGAILAYTETGGANPQHNADAKAHIQAAITSVLAEAGHTPEDVACLVAALAGINSPDDQEWATQYTAVSGLECPRLHLNDAVAAHAGAFGNGPGIIAIAGTGSTIFAITDTGRHLNNDIFHQYAGAARHLAFATMQRVLLGDATQEDAAFINRLFGYWNVPDLAALRELVIAQKTLDYQDIKRAYGGMAVLVTEAAHQSPLARAACDQAVQGLATGIRLLGECFTIDEIGVVLIGSLARTHAICEALREVLALQSQKRYWIVEPALPPVAGAVLLALDHIGIPIDAGITSKLAVR